MNFIAMQFSVLRRQIDLLKLLLVVGLTGFAPLGLAQQEGAIAPIEVVKEDAAELVNSIGFYTNTQKDLMLADVRDVVDQLDHRTHTLQNRIESEWDNMSAAARVEARQTMDALRKQRIAVAEWYGSLKSSSYIAWDETKAGFLEAYNALYAAWEDAEAAYASDS